MIARPSRLPSLGVAFALGLAIIAAALPAPALAADPVIVAAGDIACGGDSDPGADCKDAAVADAVAAANPTAVLQLGDVQYEDGQLEYFQQYYDKTWGRFKSISRPATGNHEYNTPGAKGYFDYFNGVGAANGLAGERTKGYYSYNIGSWHLIALNSNCSQVGGCAAGSAQERWLRADLAANTSPCTLAYWHHPRWSSDINHLGTTNVAPLVQALYESSADVLLAGHAHLYERFAPQSPDGVMDTARGLAQFTVGTGGRSEVAFAGVYQPNSLARTTNFGALKLGLHGDYYDWSFLPVAGSSYSDKGAKTCHRAPSEQQRVLDFAPTADVTARSDRPSVNLGRDTTLKADGSPKVESFLKFTVAGLDGAKVKSAKLRLYATGPTRNSHTLSRVASTSWTEGTLNWNNRPAKGTSLATLGSASSGRWYEIDVSPLVTQDGTVSLALSSTGSDGVAYATKEAGEGLAPQLVVTAAPGDTTAPSAPSALRGSATGSTRVELSWSASTDDVAVAGYRIFRDGSPIATAPTPSYADTTVAPDTTSRYSVAAYDAAGNESARSAEVAVTTPASITSPTTMTFAPTDDAYVHSSFRDSNFGTEPTTIYDGDPVRRVLYKFTVANVPSTGVAKAILRVKSENGSVFGGSVRRVTDTDWSEGTVTWADQPAASSTALASFPATVYNSVYEVDVTQAVTGNGEVSLRIDSTKGDGGGYWSKESPLTSAGASKAASLIVTTR